MSIERSMHELTVWMKNKILNGVVPSDGGGANVDYTAGELIVEGVVIQISASNVTAVAPADGDPVANDVYANYEVGIKKADGTVAIFKPAKADFAVAVAPVNTVMTEEELDAYHRVCTAIVKKTAGPTYAVESVEDTRQMYILEEGS